MAFQVDWRISILLTVSWDAIKSNSLIVIALKSYNIKKYKKFKNPCLWHLHVAGTKPSDSTESIDSDIKIQQLITMLISILEICYSISNSNKAKRQQYFTSRCGVSALSLDNSLNIKLWYTKWQELELWGTVLHCNKECSLKLPFIYHWVCG